MLVILFLLTLDCFDAGSLKRHLGVSTTLRLGSVDSGAMVGDTRASFMAIGLLTP